MFDKFTMLNYMIFGIKGIVSLGNSIPLVRGINSTGMDSMSTKTMEEVAKGTFLGEKFI